MEETHNIVRFEIHVGIGRAVEAIEHDTINMYKNSVVNDISSAETDDGLLITTIETYSSE